MKNEFMSPECFMDVEHYSVSPFEFGENSFNTPKLSKDKAEYFLESLKKNGLEGEDERALDIVQRLGNEYFMSYAKLYCIENIVGELVFVPGITMDKIVDDVFFNTALCKELSVSLSFFRKNLESKIVSTLISWAEERKWSGIISEFGVNYMDNESLSKASFEAIWNDYDMIFPRPVTSLIAEEYGMDSFHFSEWLNIASYVSGLSEGNRKLVDHVFLDEMKCPDNLIPRFPLWNHKVNMIGNLVLALDYLNEIEENHFDLSLEKKVWELLATYSISPSRIGFNVNNKIPQETKRA